MPPEHHWHGPFPGPYGSPFGHFVVLGLSTLFLLLVLGGIAWIALRLLRRGQPLQAAALSAQPSALEIVRRRYATGQIDREAFEEMVGHLLASEERERPPVPPQDLTVI